MKTCLFKNCTNPVFSKGYCKYHAPKKPIRKDSKQPTGEAELFYNIYMKKYSLNEWKSHLSGKRLFEPSSIYFYNQFAHILSKGKYPKYRLVEDNILLLTPEEHYLLDFGTEMQRLKYAKENDCNWDIIKKLKEELLNS